MTPESIKVLVVEDEDDLREILILKLQDQGFFVNSVDRGDKVISALEGTPADVVLLDQIMPGMHGLDVLLNIRKHNSFNHIPVIMLTGLGGEIEKIRALDGGADDYVTKPFMARELGARIRAVYRRSTSGKSDPQPNQLINKNIVVDFNSHKVFLNEDELELTLTEFKLLSELLIQAGRVLSRDELRHRVLGKETITDRTIDVHMAALRKKLGNRGEDIQTVRGVGYRFSGQTEIQ